MRHLRTVTIQCHGASYDDSQPALPQPIPVKVAVHGRVGEGTVIVAPQQCPYRMGERMQQCSASNRGVTVFGYAYCPFTFVYPQIARHTAGWTPPLEVQQALEEVVEALMEDDHPRSPTRP